MKRTTNKTLLAILISLACALIIAGTVLTIYDYVSNDAQSSEEGGVWTDNY